jgi:hypothetical protein
MLSKHKGTSHAEDSIRRYGCILGHAERSRRSRPAAQEPPPPVAPVGKAPIGKAPIGKAPIGKYPAPVVTKG